MPDPIKNGAESPKAKDQPELATAPDADPPKPTGHLTRDQMVAFAYSRHIAAGKTPDEAKKLALKRGFEVIPA